MISGHRLGEPERIGEILEVLGEPGREHRVRWDDDRERSATSDRILSTLKAGVL